MSIFIYTHSKQEDQYKMEIRLQAYLVGSNEAVEFYKKAFGAELGCIGRNPDGTFMHAEIVLNNHLILSLSECSEWSTAGMNMQFGINFDKGNEAALINAYEVLKEGGHIHHPLGKCDWSEAMADLTDKFGIRWFIAI